MKEKKENKPVKAASYSLTQTASLFVFLLKYHFGIISFF